MFKIVRRVLTSLILSFFIFSPLMAERISNGFLSLNVPQGLEIQNEAFDLQKNRSSDFHLVLQQEGLNNLESDAFNRYLRVMITIFDSKVEGYTNEDFKREIEDLTQKELNDLYDDIEEMFGLSDIVSRNKRDIELIDGYYALHINIERNGITEEKGSVIVDGYFLAIGQYLVYISTSYRKQNERESLPLIKSTLSSLKFNINEDEILLYENTLPGVDFLKFKWPEKYPEWSFSYSFGVAAQSIGYYTNENVITVLLGSAYTPLSRKDIKNNIIEMRDHFVSSIRKEYRGKDVRITRDNYGNDYMYIDFEYVEPTTLDRMYGRIYARYIDNSRQVSFMSYSLFKNNNLLDSVCESLGFSLET